MTIPLRVGTALLAWALIIFYAIMMLGMIGDVRAAVDKAPQVDDGLVRLTTALGTGVVGVIAGLFGVVAPNPKAVATTPGRIGSVLTAKAPAPSWVSDLLGVLYVLTYLFLICAAIWAWSSKTSELTPDFLEGQAVGAIGLIAACAVAKGGSQ